MKEKILAALKTKYKTFGFGAKAFDGVATYLEQTVTADDQIETAIAGVEGLLKSFQADADKLRTENANYKKQLEGQKTKEDDEDKKEPGKTDPPADGIEAILAKALKPLTDEIASLKGAKAQETLSTKLVGLLKEKNIPETFYKNAIANREFKDEEEITTLVETLDTGYTELRNSLAQEGLGGAGKPVIGGGAKLKDTDVSPEMQNIINERKDAAKPAASA